MDIKDLTQALIEDAGFSQQRLANELKARGIRCSQPMIWRILNQPGFDPKSSVVDGLRGLYADKVGSAEEDTAA